MQTDFALQTPSHHAIPLGHAVPSIHYRRRYVHLIVYLWRLEADFHSAHYSSRYHLYRSSRTSGHGYRLQPVSISQKLSFALKLAEAPCLYQFDTQDSSLCRRTSHILGRLRRSRSLQFLPWRISQQEHNSFRSSHINHGPYRSFLLRRSTHSSFT